MTERHLFREDFPEHSTGHIPLPLSYPLFSSIAFLAPWGCICRQVGLRLSLHGTVSFLKDKELGLEHIQCSMRWMNEQMDGKMDGRRREAIVL